MPAKFEAHIFKDEPDNHPNDNPSLDCIIDYDSPTYLAHDLERILNLYPEVVEVRIRNKEYFEKKEA